MQLDLGHLQLSNRFEWRGGVKEEPFAVHLDIMEIKVRVPSERLLFHSLTRPSGQRLTGRRCVLSPFRPDLPGFCRPAPFHPVSDISSLPVLRFPFS